MRALRSAGVVGFEVGDDLEGCWWWARCWGRNLVVARNIGQLGQATLNFGAVPSQSL